MLSDGRLNIEVNPEDKKSEFQVYGLENFITKENRFEKLEKYFHPLPGVMITSGTRLFLTIAEARLKDLELFRLTMGILIPCLYFLIRLRNLQSSFSLFNL